MTDAPRRRTRFLAPAAAAVLVAAAAIWLLGGRSSPFTPVPPANPVPNRAFLSPAGPQAPATMWAVGDGADGSGREQKVVAMMARTPADRILYLGDVYETGSPAEFARGMRAAYGSGVQRMVPTPGNHEWPAHRTGYDAFWRSVTGAPTPPWYSFDQGGWHLISLNSEVPDDARQLAWLRADLAAAKGCVLAFLHRPRFNAGLHGDAADTQPLWGQLAGRATLVLAGHDHDMQRMKTVDGTQAYIAGAGGHSHYHVNASDPRLAFSNDRDFGALRVALRPGAATLSFVADTGRVLDTSTARCTPT